MVEQRVLIPCVAGSIPASPANSKSVILFFNNGKVAERLRQRIANPSSGNWCAGSSPALSSNFIFTVAQWIERRPPKPEVKRSIRFRESNLQWCLSFSGQDIGL